MTIHGNPTPEDEELAKSLIAPDETILAVLRASSDNTYNAAMQPIGCIAMLPCFWPHAVILSPCICMAVQSGLAVLNATLYVVTNRNIYRHVGDATTCCPIPGKSSGQQDLASINSVGTDMPGAACGQQCFPTKKIVLGVAPGSVLANAGGSKHTPNNRIMIFVDDPDEVMRIVREAKEALGPMGMGMNPAAMGMMMMGMAPQQQVVQQTTTQVVQATAVPQGMEMERGGEDAFEQIAKLKKLLDMGAISQAEVNTRALTLTPWLPYALPSTGAPPPASLPRFESPVSLILSESCARIESRRSVQFDTKKAELLQKV